MGGSHRQLSGQHWLLLCVLLVLWVLLCVLRMLCVLLMLWVMLCVLWVLLQRRVHSACGSAAGRGGESGGPLCWH